MKEFNFMPNGGRRKILLEYQLFAAGHCRHLECVTIKGGKFKTKKYPAICALIKHPQGNILFDTGYSSRFYQETRKWPFWIYKKITPVVIESNQNLISALKSQYLESKDIKFIILSHFHADHIAGIKDFPEAKIICSKAAWNDVSNSHGFKALKKGFLAGLLPEDFNSRVSFVEDKNQILLNEEMKPFDQGFDIFGDASLSIITLAGHAKGQIGLLFHDKYQSIFLVADSCWSSEAYRSYRLPSIFTYLLHDNKKAYQETLMKLHQLYKNNKKIKIIPSHCEEIWEEILSARQNV
jgi:glyoxylase-like metal-dependent hydrolase (beta-lactamase superfamily II)